MIVKTIQCALGLLGKIMHLIFIRFFPEDYKKNNHSENYQIFNIQVDLLSLLSNKITIITNVMPFDKMVQNSVDEFCKKLIII